MWQKIKDAFRQFMAGRHGTDELSLAMLIVALSMTLLAVIIRFPLFDVLGMVIYIWGIFRIFSRNEVKRSAENERWLRFWTRVKTACRQFFTRLKNIRKYKYFKCPECKARLRLPRKVGEVTVTCGKCKHQFKMKA